MEKTQPEKKKPKEFRPFKALFIARSDYGKSYLIADFVINLVKKKSIEPKRIISFSKTYKTDDSQQKFIKYCKNIYTQFDEKNCFESIDEDMIQKLYDGQKKIKESGGKPKPFVLIFDDMISESILTSKGKFVSIYSLMRHFNISCIFSLQAYRSTLGTTLRNQVTLLAIGALSSSGATDDILQEVDGGLAKTKKESFKIVSQWYHDALRSNDGHGFLVVNMTESPWTGQRFQRNLEDFYYDTPENKEA